MNGATIDIPTETNPDIAMPIVERVFDLVAPPPMQERKVIAQRVGQLVVHPEMQKGIIIENAEKAVSLSINSRMTVAATSEGLFAVPTLSFWGALMRSVQSEE